MSSNDSQMESYSMDIHVKKIEVCVSNVDLGSRYVCDMLEAEYPQIKVRRWGCLGYCHLCIRQPGVLIDDTTYVQAETAEALWEKVKQYIETGSAPDTED